LAHETSVASEEAGSSLGTGVAAEAAEVSPKSAWVVHKGATTGAAAVKASVASVRSLEAGVASAG
jgi:hypothetical protein